VKVRNKAEHDPVTDLGMPNSYMRWALEAVEEVAGKNGLAIILREAGLDRLQHTPPLDNDEFGGLTTGQYADLTAAILNFFGRAAKSMTARVGRVSARQAIDKQAKLFNVVALMALKKMPFNVQLKVGLGNMQDSFRKLWAANDQQVILRLEETDGAWLYISETCPECAGKAADEPICWLFAGSLRESGQWLTGKELEIVETECRATGAPACVWRINKTPKENT
jgi:predicted hydrocarbon binding protein